MEDSQMEYKVAWHIDIDADSPEDAARKALAIQRNPESIATVFNVRTVGLPVNEYTTVDISKLDGDTEV
jgi:hypothetical protein